MGLDYEVTPGVLIPRQATESIVHAALAVLKPGDRVLECGVGSGIIACSVAKNRQVDVLGIDCSNQAIELAHKNVFGVLILFSFQAASSNHPSRLDLLALHTQKPRSMSIQLRFLSIALLESQARLNA